VEVSADGYAADVPKYGVVMLKVGLNLFAPDYELRKVKEDESL
jgi:hypothetical protein